MIYFINVAIVLYLNIQQHGIDLIEKRIKPTKTDAITKQHLFKT